MRIEGGGVRSDENGSGDCRGGEMKNGDMVVMRGGTARCGRGQTRLWERN